MPHIKMRIEKPKQNRVTKTLSAKKSCNTFHAKEQAIKDKCNQLKIPYEMPKQNETAKETRSRRQRITRQCKKLINKHTSKSFKAPASKAIPVKKKTSSTIAPPLNSTPLSTTLQTNILPTITTTNQTTITIMSTVSPSTTTPPLSQTITSVTTSSVTTPIVQSTIQPTTTQINTTTPPNVDLQGELSSLHPNQDVITAMLRFEEGEMQHSIDTCKTCLETRPVFHVTQPVNKSGTNESSPVQLSPWQISRNGK